MKKYALALFGFVAVATAQAQSATIVCSATCIADRGFYDYVTYPVQGSGFSQAEAVEAMKMRCQKLAPSYLSNADADSPSFTVETEVATTVDYDLSDPEDMKIDYTYFDVDTACKPLSTGD